MVTIKTITEIITENTSTVLPTYQVLFHKLYAYKLMTFMFSI